MWFFIRSLIRPVCGSSDSRSGVTSDRRSDALPPATGLFAGSAPEETAKVRRGETPWDSANLKER